MKLAWISYGFGGTKFEIPGGEKYLVDRLIKAGVKTNSSPYHWNDVNLIVEEIVKSPKDAKIIVGGDSLGANEAPAIAKALQKHARAVNLLFGFQPSIWGQHIQVPENVIHAYCIYNPTFAETLGLGSYPWSKEPGNQKTNMHMYPIHHLHPDDWGSSQDIIYKAIITL